MAGLERAAAVLLRVPGLVLLDLLYRWDVQSSARLLRPQHRTLQGGHVWSLYYLAHVVCAVLLMLPVRYLVKMYLYLLTLMLLYVGHQTARDYMRQEMESAYQGAVYSDTIALNRVITALTGQVILSTLCSLLMKTRQVWLFSAPMLPLIARLSGVPLQTLPVVNTFATILTALEVLYVMVSNLLVPLNLAKTACREVVQVLEVYRLVALGLALWTRLAVPLLFLVFWLVLFGLQVYFFLTSRSIQFTQQGLLFVFLNSVAECCGTPYSLIGLTFTVSYLALSLLNLCKFYLLGFGAFQNGNVMHRGVTEGVTLLLLALQTGLLDLQVLQRTFLLSIILFIVVTSTLQSMIEITDPIVLALGASRNRSPWKHIRGVSMCLFLLVFPSFMAYKISRFFHMDFWLLILVSSCMLTSLQVMGTLFIYTLFMIELFQDNPVEKMDEIIYYVNAVSRVLEFLVAVCVVGYGTWESIYGEWSWMGASVIIIHSYFNVWLRAQSGWKSFLLRREAAKKINCLPKATKEQLLAHNDVCAICFQEMSVAVITSCGHFFHAGCLRKWLYVQDTCPMCHQQVNPPSSESEQYHPGGEREGEQGDGDEDAAAQDREESEPASGSDDAAPQEMVESEPVAEKEDAQQMKAYIATWNEATTSQGGQDPTPDVEKVEECNGEEKNDPSLRFSKTLSDEQRQAVLTGMEEDTKIWLNQETVCLEERHTLDLFAAREGNVCFHAGAYHGHNTELFSVDNFSGTNKGKVEAETEAVRFLKDTGKEYSQDRLKPGEFQAGCCSSGPSGTNTGETLVETSCLKTVANGRISQSPTHCKDGYPS